MLFKKPKQFSKYLGYLGNIICCRKLANIAQSGRTALLLVVAEQINQSCQTHAQAKNNYNAAKSINNMLRRSQPV